MYHIGDWYYLIVAEGGTGYNHCVTMARAKTVWGPFETAPANPILTSDREDMSLLQKCGHADIVETQNGEWYMVHLCSRPLNGEKWCTLGRETAIQKVVWDREGWLGLEKGGRFAGNETEAPAGMIQTGPEDEAEGFYDDFDEPELHVRYSSPRIDYNTFADCTAKKGCVRLTGRESLNSLHSVSLLGMRQQKVSCTAETQMHFVPEHPEQMAGLVYMYDAMNFYILGKTVTEAGQTALVLIKSDQGVITDEMEPVPIPEEDNIWLRMKTAEDGMSFVCFYSLNGVDWQQAGAEQTTRILTDEYCRGFTGAHFGMYCHDMTGLSGKADFEYFCLK